MEVAKLVLEFLKIIFSSPPIAGAVAVVCLIFFKQELKALILRLAKINFPGGTAEFASQIEKSNERLPISAEPPKPTEAPTLPQNISLSPEDANRIRQTFDAERARATLWEYRYLNHFLARHTQQFLDWLISLSMSTTIPMADAWWLPIVPNATERKAILDALTMHHLVEIKGELIEVTPKGKEYQKWRGQLPQAAS